MGSKKWREKKNFIVKSFTLNPVHNHMIKFVPIHGITEKNFVITVAAQKDIWPHGKTYPIKAIAIVINKILTPEFQVSFILNLLKYIPRNICKYKNKNNILAPFIWNHRTIFIL
jgi:hypothetical protein